MQVAAHERGRLHVFAVNRPKEDIARIFHPPQTGANRLQPDPALLAELTGLSRLDPAGAELIPISDLEGLGLSGYLAEGHDIAAETLSDAKRRLDALEGYALMLTSKAFQGHAFALGETAGLTHIASFEQPGADWRSSGPVPSEAAKPYSGTGASPRAARQKAQRLGGMIFAVFMVIIGLVIWMVL